MKKFDRLFFRSAKRMVDNKIERVLGTQGNSYRISIPPMWVDELNLYDGVEIERKGNMLCIRAKKGVM